MHNIYIYIYIMSRPKPTGFIPNTEYIDITGLDKNNQIALLKKFFNNNNLVFNKTTKNANLFYNNFHYKYILPHVAEYYQKMERNQKVKSLLNMFHPKYEIIKYEGHHIMKSEKFGESLNDKDEQLKLSSKYTINEIMKQFLREGFYHGDLYTTPKFNYSNVLISGGQIKLIDFGLVEIEKNDKKPFQTLFEEAEQKQRQKEIEKSSGGNESMPPPTPAHKRRYSPNDFIGSPTSKQRVESRTPMQGLNSPPRVRRFSTFSTPPRVSKFSTLVESPSRGEGYLRVKVYKLY